MKETPNISLSWRPLPVYSLAAQQNAYKLFGNVRLCYQADDPEVTDEAGASKQPDLRNLTVKLECESDLLAPETWKIERIRPGQFVSLPERPIRFAHDYLLSLTDETRLQFTFSIANEESQEPIVEQSETVTILPANHWGGAGRQPEMLAAFVKPNGVYVESLVRQVADLLETNGLGRSTEGYQSNTREKPYAIAAALWQVVAAQKIAYVQPPPSFAVQGQRVRLAQEISNSRIGACLDFSLLFASCLELMGLNTVIALTRGHAFVGVWLIDTSFPLLTNDDPMEIRKRIDIRDMVCFETTMIANAPVPPFQQACEYSRSMLAEENEEDFVFVIDISQARTHGIKPLSTSEERKEEVAAAESEAQVSLPPLPPLPPVRANERVVKETPDTRVDAWQRKLLDLTRRNTLLNFRDRSAGIQLFCPDISRMEDKLSEGCQFSFIAAEESPVYNSDRSEETFRMQTGNDLHRSFALEQLDRDVLVANMPNRRLDSSAISLYRKAKNDLQEGGANTLFMALGMLRWKEDPRDDRAYRAPMILMPVELVRKSARAPIRVQQLADEDPIFNLTLIEFLGSEYEIDLEHLREELPEDDSGVDVQAVWQDVRHAISEQDGFEVVEECVIASFSFAKYLMWKDLKDRIDDLKKNLFVKHLIEKPQEAYYQDHSFVQRSEVDESIDPARVLTPLNCDSSQLVAVEASARPQDFVLEGPPGTGKSETIANMIAHNLAQGRKVLFVAEKIAALQVVFRRLQKIHLDHLCLELHSNKANKKAVIEQLRRAVTKREEKDTAEWVKTANDLRELRASLNSLVRELHKPSDYGISPRRAVARVAACGSIHQLDLGWGDAAPVAGQREFELLLESAGVMGLRYAKVSDLDPAQFIAVTATDWTFSWQERVVDLMQKLVQCHGPVTQAAQEFADKMGIESLPPLTIGRLERLRCLAQLTDMAVDHSLGYVFASGANERLSRLSQLAIAKGSFDREHEAIGQNVSIESIAATPVDEWQNRINDSERKWWKSPFVKASINKAAKRLGYQKFKDFTILEHIRSAKSYKDEIDQLAQEFQAEDLWTGWQTSEAHLQAKYAIGEQAHRLLKQAIGLVDVAQDLLVALNSRLVDGRDFLDGSSLFASKDQFVQVTAEFNEILSLLTEQSLVPDKEQLMEKIREQFEHVINRAGRLQGWVDWQAACKDAEAGGLESLREALESNRVSAEDAKEQVHTAFCKWLAPRLIDANDTLRQFRASEHEVLVEKFRELDGKVADTTGAYISALFAQSMPDINSPEHSRHFATLSRELQKKTRHKPVRVLFQDMGERLLDICPCMMMSPLSVAQFMPSDFNAFDVVIFDEASQVTTWDAVGAIARGKNVIVVGDPKQMPPTNFFSAGVDEEDPDEEDLESILDQALAARLPHRRLMGHYRSRHETLIAFSNSKYYENSLTTYPSSERRESAVTLQRVDGIYAKGKGRNNPIEAKAVVAEAVRRLSDPKLSKLSLGIVTLNSEQQRTIEDLLDEARRQHPQIEPFFHATDDYDPVFVKNLESVQGDERDLILFSLGYGPTEPGGKTMSMNFGPLNKVGGERRLNVAITRATTEVMIFASFDSSMLDLSRTSATAVEHLKHYLEFAEQGPVALAQQSSADHGVDQFDSDFEKAVASELRLKGWKVQTQVGVSKFRIDLGVVHPSRPGNYLAGVECDGATYHGSPSARDRDRIRHIVLESLGWRLIRLWSTDYFRDPVSAIERIDEQLKLLIEQDRYQSGTEMGTAEAVDKATSESTSLETNEARIEPARQERVNPQPSSTSEHIDESISIAAKESRPDEEGIWPSDIYYEPGHKSVLNDMAREILTERPGITRRALALEIAERHGLSRTSKKQIAHLENIINGWAGIWRGGQHRPVYWLSPDDVQEVIPWRGLDPFGYNRDWSEIAYPEALGLALQALKERPEAPIDYMFDAFQIKRRHPKTIAEFESWMASAMELNSGE